MADRSRNPIGHIRATYTGKKSLNGKTCQKIYRNTKKAYIAEFSDQTSISSPDTHGLQSALRQLYGY
jgi:hypothetical protein